MAKSRVDAAFEDLADALCAEILDTGIMSVEAVQARQYNLARHYIKSEIQLETLVEHVRACLQEWDGIRESRDSAVQSADSETMVISSTVSEARK